MITPSFLLCKKLGIHICGLLSHTFYRIVIFPGPYCTRIPLPYNCVTNFIGLVSHLRCTYGENDIVEWCKRKNSCICPSCNLLVLKYDRLRYFCTYIVIVAVYKGWENIFHTDMLCNPPLALYITLVFWSFFWVWYLVLCAFEMKRSSSRVFVFRTLGRPASFRSSDNLFLSSSTSGCTVPSLPSFTSSMCSRREIASSDLHTNIRSWALT